MSFRPAHRVASFGTTIFSEFTRLAAEHGAINLGQGFPDFDGPEVVKAAAIAAIRAGDNQYAVSSGQPELRRAIAEHVWRFYGQAYDPDTEVTVVSGATEGLFSTLQGLVDPGDEVIVFEPFYDGYVPDTLMAGGVPRFVPLRPPDWSFDPAELAAAFNARTRLIIVNTPHNPTGKVYGEAELGLIAELCQKWNVLALSDEVYEHIVFDGAKHVRLAQWPGMAERTVTISSQGKTFSFTGWKVASVTPMQAAAAVALGLDEEYYRSLITEYQVKRDFLANALREAGMRVSLPQGTYFIMADFSPLGYDDDVTFCRWLTTQVGVAAIPPSAFYSDEHKYLANNWARFAFCKKMETLEQAAERLRKVAKT
jgi:N-succinyldiaminopimelate aminotransferase